MRALLLGRAMEFSRHLRVLPPDLVVESIASRGETAPALDHDVVSDAFIEKASTLSYCDAGAWRVVGGAD